MKLKINLTVLFVCFFLAVTAQNEDMKIPFEKGTLKICSTKNFKIKGHDGKDVIIKAKDQNNTYFGLRSGTVASYVNKAVKAGRGTVATTSPRGTMKSIPRTADSTRTPSYYVGTLGHFEKQSRGKGLKKLGKKAEAEASGIFLKISEEDGVLTIADDNSELFYAVSDQVYEMLVPHSVKLNWNTTDCAHKRGQGSMFYAYNTKSADLTDFKGEVEISASMKNFKLVDVTGPVSINTIGGNVTVEFQKTKPQELYSVYSNNGFIDITLPESSGVDISVAGNEILSNLDFKIDSETITESGQHMRLKLGSGKVKLNLDAGLGTVYLRKK